MKFSIIVPMYNVELYLDKCIDSLLSQTYNDYEIILIDDCSSDNTLNIARKWSLKSTKIVLIEKSKNSGLSDTRNIGIKRSCGDYLLFVDSDDYIEKDTLKNMYDIIFETKADIIYAGFFQEYPNNISIKKYGYNSKPDKLYNTEEYMYSELESRNLFAAAAFGVYKRDLITDNCLFFKIGILHEDEHWTPRLLMNSSTIFLSSYHFYHYVKREGSITTKKDRTQNGLDLINTCIELKKYSLIHLKDSYLQKLYNNQLAKLYMKAVCIGELDYKTYRHVVDRFFPIKNAYKIYDIAKALLFMTSISLYKRIDKLFGDNWR